MISISLLFAIAIVTHRGTTGGASASDNLKTIFLRHYVGPTVEEYDDYYLKNASEIPSKLSAAKPTVLYIHGYTENVEKSSVRTVVQAYLERNDHNVLAVDYGELVNGTYIEAVSNISRVARAIAGALGDMVKSGFDSKKLHIVAHSLGAQVAGSLGRKLGFKIPRITGLDPAGPGFNIFLSSLSESDANFVDIIHTDLGHYGVARSAGTVNFFPNGGRRVQPGCPETYTFSSAEEYCSHHRSWRFYAESVLDESAFLGVKCSSLKSFVSDECSDNARVVMGYGTPKSARGNVYLVTAAQSPFGMKLKGIEPAPTP